MGHKLSNPGVKSDSYLPHTSPDMPSPSAPPTQPPPQELSLFGNLRKVSRCGPVAMFRSLLSTWRSRYPAPAIADKVKHFFR